MLIGSPQAVAGQAGESEKTPQAIEATDAVLKGASLTLKVDGMVCPFCAYGLEKRLRELPALDETLIQMSDGLVQIRVKEGEQYITELEWFVKGGYTKPEVLVAATKDSAEILGMDDKLGTLEPGKLADVLVLEGRPDETLRDPRECEPRHPRRLRRCRRRTRLHSSPRPGARADATGGLPLRLCRFTERRLFNPREKRGSGHAGRDGSTGGCVLPGDLLERSTGKD